MMKMFGRATRDATAATGRATALIGLGLAGSCLLAGCGSPPVGDKVARRTSRPVVSVSRQATLVVGDVANDPSESLKIDQPFADELARRLGGAGIEKAKVVVAASPDELAALMAKGSVDLYIDSPYPAMLVAGAARAVPIMRRWKGGVGLYRSAIFVSRDSTVRTLAQLSGARVGMEESFSTTGYWLPSQAIRRRKLKLRQLTDPAGTVPAGTVGYVLTGSDENTLYAVRHGKSSAGAMDERALDELAGPGLTGVRVVHRSEFVPRQIVIRSSHLSAQRSAAVQAALRGMADDQAGRAAMAAYEKTTRFDALTPELLARLRDMHIPAAPSG